MDIVLPFTWSRSRSECEWLSQLRQTQLTDWAVGITTGRHTWSPRVSAILDMPPGVVPAVEDGLRMYVPESRAVLVAAFGAAVKHGTPYDLELCVTTAAGRVVRVRSRGVPLVVGGSAVAIAGAFEEL